MHRVGGYCSNPMKPNMKQEMPARGRASSSGNGGPLDEGVTRRLKFFKVFLLSSPPEYAGNPDPDWVEAVEWLRRVKKCLNVIDVPEDLRVDFAAYTLTGAADHWWDFMKRIRDVESMTWEEFEKLFLEKYYPPFLEGFKERQLLDLTQGNMSVAQYEAKFIQHIWHVPNLVKSDFDAVRRFEDGLRPCTPRSVHSDDSDDYDVEYTYNERVAEALWREQEKHEIKQDTVGGKMLRMQQKEYQQNKQNRTSQYITCYRCGQPGHIQSHCPID